MVIDSFDISDNLWTLYPDMKSLLPNLYKNDKSKGKEISSMVGWALLLAYHPRSPYASMFTEDAKKEIEKELPKLPKAFSWDKYHKDAERIVKASTTKAEKFLSMWEKELEDRFALISSIPYALDTPQELIEFKEKMMGLTDKMWSQYEKCLKTVRDEKQTSAQGDEELSLADQNLI